MFGLVGPRSNLLWYIFILCTVNVMFGLILFMTINAGFSCDSLEYIRGVSP